MLVKDLKAGEDTFFSSFATVVGPGCALYHGVTPADTVRIVDEHVEKGVVLQDLLRRNPVT